LTEAVIVALITAAASVICQLIISAKQGERNRIQNESSQKIIEYKIDKLTEKQEKYNNLQERIALVEASAKSAHHRLDSLENNIENRR
jgi:uncharacterized protein YlxW (UPF0749 family)